MSLHENGFNNKYKLMDEDYDRFLNSTAKSLEPSLIRRLCAIQARAPEGTVFFGSGLPNSSLFPFADATLTLKTGESLFFGEKKFTDAQQYAPTTGYPPLLEQAKELVLKYHNPPNFENSKVTITAGGQDGFSRSLDLLLSPGDYLIVENPTFCGVLSMVKQYRINILGVKSDAFGMIPDSLKEILSKWDPETVRKTETGVPKVMYINPTAANPSGVTVTGERKKEIYEIARTYNLLILEDDPYYFIQFGGTKNFPESFLSIDTDGRVLRFDSFSKIISAGFRIGYMTGPEKLVGKYIEHTENTILQANTLSQVIISELLKKWSFEGLENHIDRVRKFYNGQSEALNAAAKKHLTGLCEWNVPTGGMFLWLKVLVLEDVEKMVLERGLNKGIILMPGNTFMANEKMPCPYVRLSFSFISTEVMDEACRRMAELIQEEVAICTKINIANED